MAGKIFEARYNRYRLLGRKRWNDPWAQWDSQVFDSRLRSRPLTSMQKSGEILPVEVGCLSHYLRRVLYIPGRLSHYLRRVLSHYVRRVLYIPGRLSHYLRRVLYIPGRLSHYVRRVLFRPGRLSHYLRRVLSHYVRRVLYIPGRLSHYLPRVFKNIPGGGLGFLFPSTV